jgi:hypothetical protein
MPVSASKSMLPKATRASPGTATIVRRPSQPRAVSSNAIRRWPGSAAAVAASDSGSALASIAVAEGAARSMARSSSNQGVCWLLMRTIARRPPARHAATASRARALASGATASSRSRITSCAPLAAALSKRSGRSPGTNSRLRATGFIYSNTTSCEFVMRQKRCRFFNALSCSSVESPQQASSSTVTAKSRSWPSRTVAWTTALVEMPEQ